jgi:hypothetical protein
MSVCHNFGEAVLPVFRTQRPVCGRLDTVTIISQNKLEERAEMVILWASGNYVAFTRDVSRVYEPVSGTRLLKFPSGELPIHLKEQRWGRSLSSPDTTPFLLDELQWMQRGSRSSYFLCKAMVPSSTTMELNSTQGLPVDGGLVKIEDEYIGYSQLSLEEPTKVQRGFQESVISSHAVGTPVYPVFFLPVTVLAAALPPHAHDLSLSSCSDFPTEGYLKCGKEIIGYTGASKNGLAMPTDVDGRGILRGAFGTEATSQPVDALAYSFPVRYADRFASRYEGTELAYFEAARYAPGSLWQRVNWTADIPSLRYLGIQVRVRVDGKPSWDESPTNAADGIFEFNDPEGLNRLDISGDTLEVRVYFTYKKDAWLHGFWKTKAILKSLSVEYRQPMRVWESR